MSVENQARALMMRHHHLVKNRQQSMLARSGAEVGLTAEELGQGLHIQGKPSFAAQQSYDRSRSTFS